MAAWLPSDMLRGSAFSLALFLVAPVWATTDLLQAVETALDYDASLTSAEAGQQAAAQAVPKARAGLLPRIDVGWGRAWNRIEVSGQPDLTYWQRGWQVAMSQPIFNWRNWTGYRQSELVAAKGDLEYLNGRQDLILQVAQSYFDVLAASEEVARSRRYVQAVVEHLAQVQMRKRLGEATLIDIQDARASLQQAELQREQAHEAHRVKRLQLVRLIGQEPGELAVLSEGVDLSALDPGPITEWVEQGRHGAFPVQLAHIDQRIADLTYEQDRADHLPVVSLVGSYTPSGAASGYSQPTTTKTVMLQVSMPLFAGGGIRAKQNESGALARKAAADALTAERESERVIREGHLKYMTARDRSARLVDYVEASRAALEATRVGYDLGSRSSVDVLRALNGLYSSESSLIQGRYEVIMAVLRLKLAVGALGLEDVAQVARLLGGTPATMPTGETSLTLKKSWQLEGAP